MRCCSPSVMPPSSRGRKAIVAFTNRGTDYASMISPVVALPEWLENERYKRTRDCRRTSPRKQ